MIRPFRLLVWKLRRRSQATLPQAPTRHPPPPASTARGEAPSSKRFGSGVSLDRWLGLDGSLFAATLVLFLVTRLYGLSRFPIFFFSDEAVQSVSAADFLDHGLRNSLGELLPTYFRNDLWLNLSVSVYAQVVPYLLFGFSEFATRATSVLIALSGTAAVGLMLRDVFRVRFWWVGSLVLVATPAWFQLSRTAFETVFAVSFYAWFLYFYTRVRASSGVNLYPALVFAALAFYSYAATQIVVVATGLAFAASDFNFYRRNRRLVLHGMALLVLLSLPYVRFLIAHGDESAYHLRAANSYLTADTPLWAKLSEFWHEYSLGLSPSYWLLSDNHRDLVRDRMEGYGHLLAVVVPFLILGLIACLRRPRSPPHRVLLIATLCAPLGGALIETNVYRDLIFVVPAALLSALGLAMLLTPLGGRIRYWTLATTMFVSLSGLSVVMLWDALANGPTWFRDYGVYGMQYGGRQVTAAVELSLAESPNSTILLSPTWANGTDTVVRFFLPDEQRVQTKTIEGFMLNRLELDATTLFVMTPDEYERTRRDPRFTDLRVEKTVPYPDGRPGFYFVRLRYSPQAASIFAAQARRLRRLVRETIMLDGQQVAVAHSRFDIGEIQDVFDGDTFTLARTLQANPSVVRLTFPRTRLLTAIAVTTATMLPLVTVTVSPARTTKRLSYSKSLPRIHTDPTLTVSLRRAVRARSIEIRVRDVHAGVPAHVHIREIRIN